MGDGIPAGRPGSLPGPGNRHADRARRAAGRCLPGSESTGCAPATLSGRYPAGDVAQRSVARRLTGVERVPRPARRDGPPRLAGLEARRRLMTRHAAAPARPDTPALSVGWARSSLPEQIAGVDDLTAIDWNWP